MKQFFIMMAITAVFIAAEAQPQLSWRFANPRIIRVSGTDRFEFDVQVKADEAGTYFWSGQVNLTFNNTAFQTTGLSVNAIRSGMSNDYSADLGDYKYDIVKTVTGTAPNMVLNVALIPSEIAILNETPSAAYSTEMTTEWQTFVKLQLKYSTNVSEWYSNNVRFSSTSMNGQQAYHSSPGNYTYYESPNLYETSDFAEAFIERIYCSTHGWSQKGGSVDNVQHIDWSVNASTTIWDAGASITQTDHTEAWINHLIVLGQGHLTVGTNKWLSIDGSVIPAATLITLEPDASLRSPSGAVSQFRLQIKRHFTGNKYHLFSTMIESCVTGSYSGSYLYDFDDLTQSWTGLGISLSTYLFPRKGYLMYYAGESVDYEMEGIVRFDPFIRNLSYHTANGYTGFNLTGNNFSSAIDWDIVKIAGLFNVQDAVWIWNADAGNYASYGDGIGTNGGSRYIPAGQGFFVKTLGLSARMTVDYSSQVHSNQPFMKKNAVAGQLRILAKANGFQDETVIVLDATSSPNASPEEDIEKMWGASEAPQLYSISADGSNLSIQKLAVPEGDFSIPVGFSLNADQEVVFEFDGAAGLSSQHHAVLIDIVEGVETDLETTPNYSFTYHVDDPAERFWLHLKHLTGLDDNTGAGYSIWSSNDKVFYNIPESKGTQLLIQAFNTAGIMMYQEETKAGNRSSFTIPDYEGIALISIQSKKQQYHGKAFLKR